MASEEPRYQIMFRTRMSGHRTVTVYDEKEGLDSYLEESMVSPTLHFDCGRRWGFNQEELKLMLPYIQYFVEHGKLPDRSLEREKAHVQEA